MSHAATAWAFCQRIPVAEKFVLVAIADHTDYDETCFPSYRLLSEKTSMHPDTVRRAIASLCERGLVEKAGRFTAQRRQTSNLYELRLDRGEQPKAPRNRRQGGGGSSVLPRMQDPPRGRTQDPPLKNPNRNHVSKTAKVAASGKAQGQPGKIKGSEADEALRRHCHAALRGDAKYERTFVDYGTPAFNAWIKTFARLGIDGPPYARRFVGNEQRNGAYLPAAWPPDSVEVAA